MRVKGIILKWPAIIILLLGAILIPIILCGSCEAVTEQPDIAVTEGITLVPFDYEVLKSGESKDINMALYPSGMQLPTKYLDFLDFAPMSGYVSKNLVTEFLKDTYPSAHGNFTYAEYMAACRFIYFTKLNVEWGKSNPVIAALSSVSGTRNYNWNTNITDLTLFGTTWFHTAATTYESVLKSYANTRSADKSDPLYVSLVSKREDGSVLSVGIDFSFNDFSLEANPFVSETVGQYSDVIQGWPAYIESFDLICTSTNKQGAIGASGRVELQNVGEGAGSVDPEITGPAPVQTVKPSVPVYVPPKEDPLPSIPIDATLPPAQSFEVHSPVTPTTPAESIQNPTDDRDVSPIQSVETSVPPVITTPEKDFNFRDIIGVCAIVFVVICILVFWVVHTIKHRNDPTQKWTH